MAEAKTGVTEGAAKDPEPKKSKPPKFKLSERVAAADASKFFSDLAQGLKSGTIKLESGSQKVTLATGPEVHLRIKASEKLSSDELSTKGRVKIRLSIRAPKPNA